MKTVIIFRNGGNVRTVDAKILIPNGLYICVQSAGYIYNLGHGITGRAARAFLSRLAFG